MIWMDDGSFGALRCNDADPLRTPFATPTLSHDLNLECSHAIQLQSYLVFDLMC